MKLTIIDILGRFGRNRGWFSKNFKIVSWAYVSTQHTGLVWIWWKQVKWFELASHIHKKPRFGSWDVDKMDISIETQEGCVNTYDSFSLFYTYLLYAGNLNTTLQILSCLWLVVFMWRLLFWWTVSHQSNQEVTVSRFKSRIVKVWKSLQEFVTYTTCLIRETEVTHRTKIKCTSCVD